MTKWCSEPEDHRESIAREHDSMANAQKPSGSVALKPGAKQTAGRARSMAHEGFDIETAREKFITSYARELARTDRFDVGAYEMIMRNSLSGMSETECRLWLPFISDAASSIGVGLFVAAEIMTGTVKKDLARYCDMNLAEAARRLRKQVDNLPKEMQALADQVKRAGEYIKAHLHVPWYKRLLKRKGGV